MSLLSQLDFYIHCRGKRKLRKNTVLHLEEVRKAELFFSLSLLDYHNLLQPHVEYKRVLCLVARQIPATCMKKSQTIPGSRETVTTAATCCPSRMWILSTTRSSLISSNRPAPTLWSASATAAPEPAPLGFPSDFSETSTIVSSTLWSWGQ